MWYSWVAAQYKAEILNKQFGTNFTQEEVFFGSGAIDQLYQMRRGRFEVNGDLFHQEKQK